MLAADDAGFLRRALRLAMNGRGRVEPNPMVGCVLVKDGRIIGEGYHSQFGGPHAEPAALADAKAKGHDPAGATAYVTLEPCCHTNKKTPPCAPRLIDAGIRRVVIGTVDPNADVNGNGIRMLRLAGVTVDTAPEPLAAECRQLIAPFIRANRDALPYVTLKWAESANGYVGGPNRTPVAITGPLATRVVHELRTRCHGIGVGIGTVLSDNPQLTVREVPIVNIPSRHVFDRRLRMPVHARMLREHQVPVHITTTQQAAALHHERLVALKKMLARVEALDATAFDDQGILHTPGMSELRGKHLMIEPGPTLAKAFLPWADRVWVFRSTKSLPDDPTAPRAAAIPGHYVVTGTIVLGDDVLTEYLNTRSDAYYAPASSADLVLTRDAVEPSHA
ncbi:MAG: bifunctional diaminohydroxyphosphoribosylaminopyrimidine deaminase/5-amino-6-(5-phosphoribosylamino)uracil reductase RibD [Tepidisphaeraceae bacterium]